MLSKQNMQRSFESFAIKMSSRQSLWAGSCKWIAVVYNHVIPLNSKHVYSSVYLYRPIDLFMKLSHQTTNYFFEAV